jgi:hypothetical protein
MARKTLSVGALWENPKVAILLVGTVKIFRNIYILRTKGLDLRGLKPFSFEEVVDFSLIPQKIDVVTPCVLSKKLSW